MYNLLSNVNVMQEVSEDLSEFWYTVYTMKDKYGSSYKSFTLFSSTHLFWLALCVLLCIGGFILYRRADEKAQLKTLRGLSIAILITEGIRQVVIISTGQWQPETLPLHLCSINIFVCLWHSIHPTSLAKHILYTLCLPGALIALLSPTWLALPINNICHITSEALHIELVLYPILLLAGGFKPDIKQVPKVIIVLLIVCCIIQPINKTLGTNFMFINGYEDNIITEVFASIFGNNLYIIGFIPVIAVLVAVLYLPWILAERKRNKAIAKPQQA